MNIEQAKQLSLTAIMEQLGHRPVRTHDGGNEWEYLSPLREEKEGSFGINIRKNVFYDLGSGQGGNIIDFAKLMASTDQVSEALRWLDQFAHTKPPTTPILDKQPTEYQISIDRMQPLTDPKLQQYLSNTRQLALPLVASHVQEVHYHNGRKGPFYAVGFANDSNGYELRTHGFKGSTSKDITHIRTAGGRARQIHVFEGFTDYLSLLTLTGRQRLNTDVLVLNGTAMAERGSAALKTVNYEMIFTWLDIGQGGERVTGFFARQFPKQVYPMNGLYSGHDDLNAYLVAQRRQHSLSEVQQQFKLDSSRYRYRSPYLLAEAAEGQGRSH